MSKRRERRRAEALKKTKRIRELLNRSGTYRNEWYCPWDDTWHEIYDQSVRNRAKNGSMFPGESKREHDGYRKDVPKVREKRQDLSDL